MAWPSDWKLDRAKDFFGIVDESSADIAEDEVAESSADLIQIRITELSAQPDAQAQSSSTANVSKTTVKNTRNTEPMLGSRNRVDVPCTKAAQPEPRSPVKMDMDNESQDLVSSEAKHHEYVKGPSFNVTTSKIETATSVRPVRRSSRSSSWTPGSGYYRRMLRGVVPEHTYYATLTSRVTKQEKAVKPQKAASLRKAASPQKSSALQKTNTSQKAKTAPSRATSESKKIEEMNTHAVENTSASNSGAAQLNGDYMEIDDPAPAVPETSESEEVDDDIFNNSSTKAQERSKYLKLNVRKIILDTVNAELVAEKARGHKFENFFCRDGLIQYAIEKAIELFVDYDKLPTELIDQLETKYGITKEDFPYIKRLHLY